MRLIICHRCKLLKPSFARGWCKNCYQVLWHRMRAQVTQERNEYLKTLPVDELLAYVRNQEGDDNEAERV